MCRVLGVSPSGYYAWRSRGLSARARRDEELRGAIRAIHEASRGTYGVPRVHAELAAQGCRVSRKRVATADARSGSGRSESAPRGAHPRAPIRAIVRPRTGWSVSSRPRRRTASGWPTSPTCRLGRDSCTWPWCSMWFSRRVVGWSMANHLRTELVLNALNMALAQRRPEQVIHHSDQGTQYTSLAFGKRCRETGVIPSDRVGRRLL